MFSCSLHLILLPAYQADCLPRIQRPVFGASSIAKRTSSSSSGFASLSMTGGAGGTSSCCGGGGGATRSSLSTSASSASSVSAASLASMTIGSHHLTRSNGLASSPARPGRDSDPAETEMATGPTAVAVTWEANSEGERTIWRSERKSTGPDEEQENDDHCVLTDTNEPAWEVGLSCDAAWEAGVVHHSASKHMVLAYSCPRVYQHAVAKIMADRGELEHSGEHCERSLTTQKMRRRLIQERQFRFKEGAGKVRWASQPVLRQSRGKMIKSSHEGSFV
ncbi:unnamed protein product [Protopolystoma xenopodis]|uniref:Uncharacterized protein n=1 Tax=Protopolystoma xenopodis TaxID=117903 RepID=A0A448WFI3_9PLAT|nr:unnamed protein product [Protopolystoma xenopodis]